MAEKVLKNTKQKEPVRYTKTQLASAKRYQGKKDLITALLKEGKSYTTEEADQLLDVFLKGKVSAC